MLCCRYRELPAMILSIDTSRYALAEIQRREQSLAWIPPQAPIKKKIKTVTPCWVLLPGARVGSEPGDMR